MGTCLPCALCGGLCFAPSPFEAARVSHESPHSLRRHGSHHHRLQLKIIGPSANECQLEVIAYIFAYAKRGNSDFDRYNTVELGPAGIQGFSHFFRYNRVNGNAEPI